jgi:hypothetical protein
MGRIFSGVKILSMPSFGREVKQFVLCRRFAARKRTLLDYVEVGSLRPNYPDVSRSKFPPSLTEGLQWSSRFAGAPSKCPYTRAAWAPTGDERRQPKVTRCTRGMYKAWVLTGYGMGYHSTIYLPSLTISPRFNPRPVHVGSVTDSMVLRQVFWQVLWLSPVSNQSINDPHLITHLSTTLCNLTN